MDGLPLLLAASAAGAVRIGAGLIFTTSGFAKLRRPGDFAAAVSDYRLLPEPTVGAAAALLIGAEIVTGLALLAGLAVACLAGALLLGLFAVAMAINLARGRTSIDCGCSLGATGQRIHSLLVWRNAGLAAALLAAAAVPVRLPAMPLLGAAVTGALLFLLYHLFNQIVALAGRFASSR